MEYIEGESLAAKLKRNPLPDTPGMLKVLGQMADALDYTHAPRRDSPRYQAGQRHDRHPRAGTTKIMDFGIARMSDTRTCHAHRHGDGVPWDIWRRSRFSARNIDGRVRSVCACRGGLPDDDRQHAVWSQQRGDADL